MCTPPALREDDFAKLRRIMCEARLSTRVTMTNDGLARGINRVVYVVEPKPLGTIERE